MVTSSTQLKNRSFHVVERTRTAPKCTNMKNARAKRAKLLLFFIVKYAYLWRSCCRCRRGCLSCLMLACNYRLALRGTWNLFHFLASTADNCRSLTIKDKKEGSQKRWKSKKINVSWVWYAINIHTLNIQYLTSITSIKTFEKWLFSATLTY